jgi:hypothetical protein
VTFYYWLFSQLSTHWSRTGRGRANAYTMALYQQVLKGLTLKDTIHLANTMLYVQ